MNIEGVRAALAVVFLSGLVTAQDCNSNGVDDAIDLVLGNSTDCNRNGIPDECDGCIGDVTLIDFEGFAELTVIENQYAAEGVTFGLLGESGGPVICVEGAPNVAFSGNGADSPLAGMGGLTDPDDGQVRGIEVDFSPAVDNPSLFVIDVDANDTVELRAYAGASLLTILGASSGDEGTGNGVGTFFRFEQAGVTRIEIEFTSDGQGYAIDDLSFQRPDPGGQCQSLIRISQETSPGAGDFDANIVGFVQVFPTSATVNSLYSYDFPASDSYNGTLLDLDENHSNLALVETGDAGLALFVVHDVPDDNSGGRAEMQFELSGDADGAEFVLYDDSTSQDDYTGNPGDSLFTARWDWNTCCTDGVVLGDLDGAFELVVSFTDVNSSLGTPTISGLSEWILHSAEGSELSLDLVEDLRVRIDTVPGPCPLSLVPNVVDISLSAGGAQLMTLDAGAENAGAIYLLLGTLSGTQPGIDLGGTTLPLNPDPYFQLTLTSPNSVVLTGQLGFLNGAGQGLAALILPPGVSPGLTGVVVHHAYALLGQPFVSNPCPARLVP